MLKNILLLVAMIVAVTALVLSSGEDPKESANAAWISAIAAIGPHAVKAAADTSSCLNSGAATCLVASILTPTLGFNGTTYPAWRAKAAFIGAVSGCASQLGSLATTTWLQISAPECPAGAFTVLVAMPLDTTLASSSIKPFREPMGWWFPTGETAAVAAFDDRFSGLVSMQLPGAVAAPVYVWARSFQP